MEEYFRTDYGVLYLGDAKDISKVVDDDSVDLIFTDPPYLRKYLYTYEYLGEFSPRVLKTGGSLISILPHFALPEVVSYMKPPMKWRWLLHMSQFSGPHARMAMGIEVTFKPMGWWVKEKFPKGGGFLMDGIELNDNDGMKKKYHHWQQSKLWAEYYIYKLCPEDGLVLDPYVGGGTVALAAEMLKRKWVAIEIEESACKSTMERLQTWKNTMTDMLIQNLDQ